MAAVLGAIVLGVVTGLGVAAPNPQAPPFNLVGAELVSAPGPQQAAQPRQAAGIASPTSPPPGDLVSIERIRKELERRPAIALVRSSQDLPVYRLRIEGYQFRLPSWKDSFVLKTGPVPPGGVEFYRMQWLAVKPTAWGVPW